MCEAGHISPAVPGGISASHSFCPPFGEGSREQNHAVWRADARSRCRLEEMEPCGARTCSDGYFTDGCVAAWIADHSLDWPRGGAWDLSRLPTLRSARWRPGVGDASGPALPSRKTSRDTAEMGLRWLTPGFSDRFRPACSRGHERRCGARSAIGRCPL